MGHASVFTATKEEIIAEEARLVRAYYPDLFAMLGERDRRIRHALYRISDPADPESLVTPQVMQQALQTLRQLDAGISELCNKGN